MEHDEKPLPVDIRTLGALAEKCRAYAKALHYKEQEFQQHPSATVEALISVNNQLQQPEAAVGMLVYAQQHLQVSSRSTARDLDGTIVCADGDHRVLG
jgi:FKBP12-rapamycin complex-associated protein